jgi:hypothetical protein
MFISCLPSISSNDVSLSTDEMLSEHVRESMAHAMKIELTNFDDSQVLDLKQRPDQFRRRHGKLTFDRSLLKHNQHYRSIFVEQRRLEFQQMIDLVHQQVPQASLEAIRYDLGNIGLS